MPASVICFLVMLGNVPSRQAGPSQQKGVEQEFARGVELLQEGKLDLAEQTFLLVIKASPQSPDPYFFLGKVYLARKDPRAAGTLLKCVELDPTRDDAWEELSRELARRRAFDRAIRIFQHYAEISPQKTLAHLLLGEAYFNGTHYTKAIEQFQKATELNSHSARAYYSLGQVNETTGRAEEAIGDFQRSLALNPTSALANYHLGDLFIAEGNYRQAVQSLNQAIQLSPDNPDFYFSLGQAYFLEKSYSEAISQLQQAVRLRPDYAQAHYLLGRCYTAQSKPELARAEYTLSRKVRKKEAEPKKAIAAP